MAIPTTTEPVVKLPRSNLVQFTLKGGALDARQLMGLRAELVDRIAEPDQPASVEVVASDAAGVADAAAVCAPKRISRQHAYALRKALSKPLSEDSRLRKQKTLDEYDKMLKGIDQISGSMKANHTETNKNIDTLRDEIKEQFDRVLTTQLQIATGTFDLPDAASTKDAIRLSHTAIRAIQNRTGQKA